MLAHVNFAQHVIVHQPCQTIAQDILGNAQFLLEIDEAPVTAEQLGGMLLRIKDNTISGKIAKTVFEAMAAGEGNADEIIEKRGLKQVTDSGAISAVLDEMLAANAEQVEQYRAADEAKRGKMFGFFVGQAMKASKGKANPQQVNELLKSKLEG